jgi:hypothetical protein
LAIDNRYQEYFQTILESDITDWIYDEGVDLYICKKDISITISQSSREIELPTHWATIFSDPGTITEIFYLKYNNTKIMEFLGVLVDEGKMLIPYPYDDNSITNIKYQIGLILNICRCKIKDIYDKYLHQAGISVHP